jgi:hypothetical protein
VAIVKFQGRKTRANQQENSNKGIVKIAAAAQKIKIINLSE